MASILCKDCGSDNSVKNGKQKGYQNYFCKSCNRNFVPPYPKKDRAIEKHLAVIYPNIAKPNNIGYIG